VGAGVGAGVGFGVGAGVGVGVGTGLGAGVGGAAGGAGLAQAPINDNSSTVTRPIISKLFLMGILLLIFVP